MDAVACSFVLKKIHKIGKAFQVVDQFGQARYHISQKQFSIGNKVVITDPAGDQVAVLRRMFSPIVPKYRVCIAGVEPFSVRRKLSLAPVYQVSGYGWTILASASRYRCYADEQSQKALFDLQQVTGSWMDRFCIDVYEREFSLHGICIAVAIDMAIDDIRKTGKH